MSQRDEMRPSEIPMEERVLACYDPRHDQPCELPCAACDLECLPSQRGILVECACCGHYHPADYWDDCRNDRKRFFTPGEHSKSESFSDCEEAMLQMQARQERFRRTWLGRLLTWMFGA